jgi:hypothetical protein
LGENKSFTDTAAVATAASMALPPFIKASTPANVAERQAGSNHSVLR